MPRRHKSKRHGHGKRNQAQSLTSGCEPAGAAALPAAEEPSPSSPASPPAGSSSGPRQTHTSPCRSSLTLEASDTLSEEYVSAQEEEEECPLDAIPPTESSPPSPQFAVNMMGKILVSNFYARQITTEQELVEVLSECYRCAFPEIFKTACVRIEDVFGVEVREVGSVPQSYNLYSKLKLPNNGRIRPGKGYPKTGILMEILGLISKFQGRVSEQNMWDFLKLINLYPGRRHRMYGEPRKLLTQDFVRLQYLEYRQVPGSEPPCYEFLWGPEAHTDTCKAKIMERERKISKLNLPFLLALYETILEKEEEESADTGEAAHPDTPEQATGDPGATQPEASPSPDDV
ncbi:melanoma-associated antigen B5-like [Ctenodactylus gundi]